MKYDIYMGSVRGYHTFRIETTACEESLKKWLDRGYRIERVDQISNSICEAYLIK